MNLTRTPPRDVAAAAVVLLIFAAREAQVKIIVCPPSIR